MNWSGTGTPRVRISTVDGAAQSWIRADGDGLARRTVGGALDDRGLPHLFRYRPFEFSASGDGVTVHPPHPLAPGQWYRVEVDGLDQDWTFRTRAPLPRPQHTLRVATDGSAPFCTVQGAIDAAAGETGPVIIEVAAGSYREICHLGDCLPPLIIRGAGRGRTVISYDNNNLLNGQPSHSRCRHRRLGDRDLYNGWRANIGVDAADIRFEDLSMINSTPLGGSQAEAFRGNHERLVLDRVEVHSFQDTMRLQGRVFLSHSLISGTVDFVWGAGAVYHWRNEYRSRASTPQREADGSFVLQVRNAAHERGHVLRQCRFTRESGVGDGSVRIARTDARAFPHSEVVLIDCEVDRHIDRSAFLITPEPVGSVRFAATGTIDEHGHPVEFSTGPGIRRATATEIDHDRDPAKVLDGWVPYTVNVPEVPVAAGEEFTVDWSAPPGHSAAASIDVAGRRIPVETDATLGTVSIRAPHQPGEHRITFGDATATVEVLRS